jgi:hypothetical protein
MSRQKSSWRFLGWRLYATFPTSNGSRTKICCGVLSRTSTSTAPWGLSKMTAKFSKGGWSSRTPSSKIRPMTHRNSSRRLARTVRERAILPHRVVCICIERHVECGLATLMRAAASRIDCHVNVSAIADPRPQESYRALCASWLVRPVEESDNPRLETPTLALVQGCNVVRSAKNGSHSILHRANQKRVTKR